MEDRDKKAKARACVPSSEGEVVVPGAFRVGREDEQQQASAESSLDPSNRSATVEDSDRKAKARSYVRASQGEVVVPGAVHVGREDEQQQGLMESSLDASNLSATVDGSSNHMMDSSSQHLCDAPGNIARIRAGRERRKQQQEQQRRGKFDASNSSYTMSPTKPTATPTSPGGALDISNSSTGLRRSRAERLAKQNAVAGGPHLVVGHVPAPHMATSAAIGQGLERGLKRTQEEQDAKAMARHSHGRVVGHIPPPPLATTTASAATIQASIGIERGLKRTQEEQDAKAMARHSHGKVVGHIPPPPFATTASAATIQENPGEGQRGLKRTQEEQDAKARARGARASHNGPLSSLPLPLWESNESASSAGAHHGLGHSNREKREAKFGAAPSSNTPTAATTATTTTTTPSCHVGAGAGAAEKAAYKSANAELLDDPCTTRTTTIAPNKSAEAELPENPCSEEVVDEEEEDTEVSASEDDEPVPLPITSRPILPDVDDAHLVQAVPVTEDPIDYSNLNQAEEVDWDQEREKEQRRKMKSRRIGAGCLCLMIAIVGIALGVTLSSKEEDVYVYVSRAPSTQPTLQPTNMPSMAPTELLDVQFLPLSTQESLRDPGSPQSKAYEWLSGHPEIGTMAEWRKIQLFALVTFFYAFEGPSWKEDIRKDWIQNEDDKSECLWYSSDYGVFEDGKYEKGMDSWNATTYYGTVCNEDDQINALVLADTGVGELNPRIPPELALLNLTILALPRNELNTTLTELIPPEVWSMTSLKVLNLHSNKLQSTIPKNLTIMNSLTELELWNNYLSGTMPSELFLLTNMENLDLENNYLNGTIPTEMGNLSRLKSLWFSDNFFSGSIPSVLGGLSDLERLQLYSNGFTGMMPSEIGLLSCLTHLDLWANYLQGTIPSELERLQRLNRLAIGINQLTGPINFILPLTKLQEIELFDNKFSGTLPPEIGELSKLTYAMLFENNLNGPLPTELGKLTAMEDLRLVGNSFIGPIPSEIGQLRSMHSLTLNSNLLNGTMPTELGNLESMQYLYLRNNSLSGRLPTELGLLTNAMELLFHINELSGTVPVELTKLVVNGNLSAMQLDTNRLTGSIFVGLCFLGEFNDTAYTGLAFDCNDNLCGCSWCPC